MERFLDYYYTVSKLFGFIILLQSSTNDNAKSNKATWCCSRSCRLRDSLFFFLLEAFKILQVHQGRYSLPFYRLFTIFYFSNLKRHQRLLEDKSTRNLIKIENHFIFLVFSTSSFLPATLSSVQDL